VKILDPGSWIQDPGNGKEKDKNPMKLDKNRCIRTGKSRGIFLEGSRTPKSGENARGVVKNEGVQVAALFRCKGGV
jgi:hypothetical protein